MRQVCKNCSCQNSTSPYRCKGDDENCEEVMRFDEGYYEAVEKAVKWLENAINGDNIEGCKDSKQLIEDFREAMEL